MNRYGARGSPWRTPVLMLKVAVSPSGINTTADVFIYITCMAFMIFSGMFLYTLSVWLLRSFLGCHTHGESGIVCFYLHSQRLS